MKTLFDTVNDLSNTLSYHRERHNVLSSNLANLDTPGYKPLDLEPGPRAANGADLSIRTTDPKHIGLGADGLGGGMTLSFDDSSKTKSADGNAVNLEREMAKINANRVRYATASELVSRRLALLRYAASDGGG